MESESGAAAPRDSAVVTRFAPSPTGFLHIGNARTGLFSWLFARHHGGKALLRIEDTDKARSTQAAIDAIFDGLNWLGLEWDGEPVYQSSRLARHAEVAQEMLARGHAYRCYMSAEELAAARAAAERQNLRLDSPWRDRSPDEAPPGAPFAVRLRAPREGETIINDLVQGRVAVQNAELDDMVMLRSDGTPTYMLAVVVDDHDMGVTHVIRGSDHLNNAFRQLAVIKAMGWREPAYGHIPLIHGADGGKLSKRHGALGVDAYRDELGILPEALFNYLLRLGWSHGDDEIISREEAIAWFDLASVGKSPSRFDLKKLESLNAHYVHKADDGRLAELVARRLGCPSADPRLELLRRAMPILKVRASNLLKLVDEARFLVLQRPIELEEGARRLLDGDAPRLLAQLYEALRSGDRWDAGSLQQAVHGVAEAAGVKSDALTQPLRAALTGRRSSPGIFDVLTLLGRDDSLARIADQTTKI